MDSANFVNVIEVLGGKPRSDDKFVDKRFPSDSETIVWVEVDEIRTGDGDTTEDAMKSVAFFEHEFWKRYKATIIAIFF